MICNLLEESHRHSISQDKRRRRVINTVLHDQVPDLLRSMLCGSSDANELQLAKHMCVVFRRYPQLLMSIINETIRQDPDMRKVFFSALVDIGQLERGLMLQNVQLKYGGKIPDRRWKLKFSPVLQSTVSFIRYPFVSILYIPSFTSCYSTHSLSTFSLFLCGNRKDSFSILSMLLHRYDHSEVNIINNVRYSRIK